MKSVYNIATHLNFAEEVAKVISSYKNYSDSLIIIPDYALSYEIACAFKQVFQESVLLLPNFITYYSIPNSLFYFLPFFPALNISPFRVPDYSTLKILLIKYFEENELDLVDLEWFINEKSNASIIETVLEKHDYISQVQSHIRALEHLKNENELVQHNKKIFIITPYEVSKEESEYLSFFSTCRNVVFFHQTNMALSGWQFYNKVNMYRDNALNLLPDKFRANYITEHALMPAPRLLTTADEFEAVKIAALIVRESLAYNKNKIAIICNNSTAGFLTTYLQRWNIQARNLLCEKLDQSIVFNYFLTLAKFFTEPSIDSFMNIIKHPLFNNPLSEDFENHYLRNKNYLSLNQFKVIFPDNIRVFYDKLHDISKESNFSKILNAHIAVFFNSCNLLVLNSDAKSILNSYIELLQTAVKGGFKIELANYTALLQQTACDFNVNDDIKSHNNLIEICNLSRTAHRIFDLVILFDEALQNNLTGLDDIEELCIYQQVSNLLKTECYFIFANCVDGREQIPSSLYLLLKLDVTPYDNPYVKWLNAINNYPFVPTMRPVPQADIAARPLKYSVSSIEKLIRDPYSYYAEYILKLKPVSELLEFQPEKEFGLFVHSILSKITPDTLGTDLIKHAVKYLNDKQVSGVIHTIWLKRLNNIKKALIECYNSIELPQIRLAEAKGQMLINHNDAVFTIVAYADCIEDYTSHYKIIDFKTSQIPTQKEITSGFFPQLAIEKCLMESNGFSIDYKSGIPIKTCYMLVDGKQNSLKQTILEFDSQHTMQGLLALLTKFIWHADYFATSLDYECGKIASYRHLRRQQEWFGCNEHVAH